MRSKLSSQEEVLTACLDIVAKEGLNALTMRRVSQVSGLSLGTLYHYFSNKSDLMNQTVATIWRLMMKNLPVPSEQSLKTYMAGLYKAVQDIEVTYPGFLSDHARVLSASGQKDQSEGMDRLHDWLEDSMLECLLHDSQIRQGRFDSVFSKADFVHMIRILFFQCLTNNDPSIESLLALMQHYLYV
ncbi:TetR/AcrR family transcriptional regulator [Atopobacter sp. AH10]|uniref:TetR/AcrR family transcriptional regulator n=1 Tax=Atopobacter sp. AH10 TaxID=2315861 RepID=UPI000EF2533D|nr:TetR/AcrR family transcriptional regulator [Atopobacter sp. AH10]RLK63066.1 TetR/AcrR family transcriptional regulator [Atopobacter sp. AH10]